ncbi:MAG: hypothetical protein FJ161_04480, partial [Gammaproteobacteria bacterium]|nr:hypothetical protein [Gammaproteobacteria bacterium]
MIQSPGVEYTIFREKTSNEVELSSDQKELMKQIPSSKKITIQSSTSIKEDFAKNDFNTLIWIQSAIDVIAHTLEHQPNSIDELDIVIDFSQNKTDYSIPINWRHIERFSRYFSYLLIKINLLIKESNRMSHLRLNVHIGYPFKKDLIVQSDQWTIIQDILVSIPQSISTLNIAIDSILPEPHLSSYSMIIDTLSRLGQLDNLY